MDSEKAEQWVYRAAVFLGAALLFLVQPIMGRYVLPWYGGSPGVWTVCLLFFQTALVAGYAYAHWLSARFPLKTQVFTHLALLVVAGLTLPITPSGGWRPEGGGDPTWQILGLLVASVGLPFVAVAATAPLLQAWYGRERESTETYRLYSVSNFGALLALVAYPVEIEARMGRGAQTLLWSWSFAAFIATMAVVGFFALRRGGTGPQVPPGQPVWRLPADRKSRFFWLALPCCGSVLLVSFTSRITQDIAVVPFLWVLPLALYLGSFVLCFDDPKRYHRPFFGGGAFVAVLAVCAACYLRNFLGAPLLVWTYSAALFFFCVVLHGELYALRPATGELTGFYLLISIGGALGGIFAGLVAPAIFNDFHELKLAVLAAPCLFLAARFLSPTSTLRRGANPRNWALLISMLIVGAMALGADTFYSDRHVIDSHRNFFGTLRVHELGKGDPERDRVLLEHGNIIHGFQLQAPGRQLEPTAYFGPGSGPALAFGNLPAEGPRRIGVVGLGIGTLAAYGRAGDTVRFYEIDPGVIRFAHSHFTYLDQSPAKVEVIPGDGRLSLEREAPQNYDILILDAFSSDAIPVHLLTREAFAQYQRHLKPEGVLVVQVTNRHLDIAPVVRDACVSLGMTTAYIDNDVADVDRWRLRPSNWMLASRNQAFLHSEAIQPLIEHEGQQLYRLPWSDDHSTMIPLIKWN